MDEECKRFERRRPSTSVKSIIHKSPAKPAVCQSRWSWWSKKSKLAQNTKTKQINCEKVRKRTTNIFYLPKSFAENLFIYLKNTNKPSTFTQVLIWYWHRWYWPCIYLLSDQYQIFQLSKLYLECEQRDEEDGLHKNCHSTTTFWDSIRLLRSKVWKRSQKRSTRFFLFAVFFGSQFWGRVADRSVRFPHRGGRESGVWAGGLLARHE